MMMSRLMSSHAGLTMSVIYVYTGHATLKGKSDKDFIGVINSEIRCTDALRRNEEW